MVEKNLLNPILIGYLEARILDSFEDEKIDSVTRKMRKENLSKILHIIKNPDAVATDELVKEIAETAAEYISNPHYLDLVQNLDKVITVHRTINDDSKQAITTWFSEMTTGMKKYIDKRIDTFEDLDEYCYYVAGTIGGFLTDLVVTQSTQIVTTQTKIMRSTYKDFGLFLQKVNIIRDFREDMLSNHRTLWPHSAFLQQNITPEMSLKSEHEKSALTILNNMITHATKHIEPTKQYVQAVPEDFHGFKKFSAIHSQMGIETLTKMKNNPDIFYSEKPVKIDKSVKQAILADPIGRLQRM